jgi:hypothetical protein
VTTPLAQAAVGAAGPPVPWAQDLRGVLRPEGWHTTAIRLSPGLLADACPQSSRAPRRGGIRPRHGCPRTRRLVVGVVGRLGDGTAPQRRSSAPDWCEIPPPGSSLHHSRKPPSPTPYNRELARRQRHRQRRLPWPLCLKSRRYSTTLGAIRSERRAYRQRQATEQTRELADADQDTTLIVSHWEFAGVGYLTTGDTALALSAAARARERRQAARDAA